MTIRPDPTFHASPKLAMEAPPENFAYTLLLSPNFSKPDALAVIDVKPGSSTFSQVVHTVTSASKLTCRCPHWSAARRCRRDSAVVAAAISEPTGYVEAAGGTSAARAEITTWERAEGRD